MKRHLQRPVCDSTGQPPELRCDSGEVCDALSSRCRGTVGGRLLRQRSRFEPVDVERGRMMSIFSYFSVIFGIPVFIAALVLRNNRFALHHAKAAGAAYLACTLFLGLAVMNCAVFLPLVFVCYIPALIGVYRASAGVEAGTAALGPAGQRIFQWIEVRQWTENNGPKKSATS